MTPKTRQQIMLFFFGRTRLMHDDGGGDLGVCTHDLRFLRGLIVHFHKHDFIHVADKRRSRLEMQMDIFHPCSVMPGVILVHSYVGIPPTSHPPIPPFPTFQAQPTNPFCQPNDIDVHRILAAHLPSHSVKTKRP
uniref:Uncharacterized protein n=1 Tax=Eutreptiella gymnastica TaxID=73025 RepID=A0A7S4G5T6_9EUGL